MTFPLNVYLLAAGGGFFAVLATLPCWRRWCLRTGLVDDPGRRKIHDQPIPLAGGLALMTGLLVPTVLACAVLWSQDASPSLGHRAISFPGHFLPLVNQDPALLDADSGFLLRWGLHKRRLELA